MLVLLLFTSGIAVAEDAWTTPWDVTRGGTSDDACFSIVDTGDGYAVAGLTNSSGQGGYDVYLVKFYSDGRVAWSKTFGGYSDDMGLSLSTTSDGGFIIVGGTQSYGSGGMDVYLIKTDANGNMQWTHAYGGVFWDCGYSARQTVDKGYIIAGDTRSSGNGEQDLYLIKTDAAGNTQWSKTYGGPGIDIARSIRQTSDGGYVMAGMTESYGSGGFDVYLLKTDANGTTQWVKTFGGPKDDIARSLEVTPDGGMIIAGLEDSYGNGGYDAFLIKTDASGNVQWSKTYGGSLDDLGRSVCPTYDGGYLLVGDTGSYGSGMQDYYVVKVDADGNTQWSKTFGGAKDDSAESAIQTSDEGFVIAGNTRSMGSGGQDTYLVRRQKLTTDALLPESSVPVLAMVLGTGLGALALAFERIFSFIVGQSANIRDKIGMSKPDTDGPSGAIDETAKIIKSFASKIFGEKEKKFWGIRAEREDVYAFGLSRREITVAVISALVLGIAILYKEMGFSFDLVSIVEFILIAGIATVAHDLGHRVVAGRFKADTEFQFWGLGTLIVIITAVLHTPFAQPSRTIINEPDPNDPNAHLLTPKEKGLIFLAGPAVSFGFVLLFALMLPFGGALAKIGMTGISLNLLAAVYNLMPFWPMDGKHIRNWNAGIYLLIFVPVLILFIAVMYGQVVGLFVSLTHMLGV